MAIISFISLYLANLSQGKVSGFVICLVLSIIGTEIGFIDTSILNKANSFGFMMFILLSNIFGELSKATPQMIVGGFVTVTITSVVLAGLFANLL